MCSQRVFVGFCCCYCVTLYSLSNNESLMEVSLVCDASPRALFSKGIFLASFQHTCTDMCLVPSKLSGAMSSLFLGSSQSDGWRWAPTLQTMAHRQNKGSLRKGNQGGAVRGWESLGSQGSVHSRGGMCTGAGCQN